MAPYLKKFHNYQGPSPELKKRMMMDWVDEKAQGYDGPLPASFTDELGPFVSGSILVLSHAIPECIHFQTWCDLGRKEYFIIEKLTNHSE